MNNEQQVGYVSFHSVAGLAEIFGQNNMSVHQDGVGTYFFRVGRVPVTAPGGLPVADPENAFKRSPGEYMINVSLEANGVIGANALGYTLKQQADFVTWELRVFDGVNLSSDVKVLVEVENAKSFKA